MFEVFTTSRRTRSSSLPTAQANEQSKQQAAQSAGAQMQEQSSQAKAAYNKQMDTFKRGFSACMDARGYSVK